jgi:hypothetical protein
MAYSDVANNQTVSLTNLKDAVTTGAFLEMNTIPTGSKQVTKSEAAYYINCSTSYAPFAAKSSNQLVVKSDLVGRVAFTVEVRCDPSNAGTLQIWTASPASAGYTLQTTLTASVGNVVSYNVSLLSGDGIYFIITHTARATNRQTGQVNQTVNGTTTTFATIGLNNPKTTTALTLSHLNTYTITANFGSQV